MGIYAGVRSSPAAARSVVEASDCVVAVGWLPAETDTGGWTATLGERGPPPRVRIDAEATHVAASSGEETQTFAAPAADVLRALAAPGAVAPRSAVQAGAYWAPGAAAAGAEAAEAAAPWPPAPGAASTDVPLTGDDAEATLQALLRPGDVLVVETMAVRHPFARPQLTSIILHLFLPDHAGRLVAGCV